MKTARLTIDIEVWTKSGNFAIQCVTAKLRMPLNRVKAV